MATRSSVLANIAQLREVKMFSPEALDALEDEANKVFDELGDPVDDDVLQERLEGRLEADGLVPPNVKKVAFVAGFAVGVIVGVIIAK
ncbi:MAG: hypothetical protein AAGB04_20285 [Pseudomonadota bacterium]